MKNSSVLFVLGFIGLTVLSAVTLVVNRMLFVDQPGLENVFSLIWTVALVFALYKMMRYVFANKTATPAAAKQEMYGAVIFLCEMIAVLVMLFSAIYLSVTLTSNGGQQNQLAMAIGVVGVLALALPLGLRTMRLISRRPVGEAYKQ